jgi:hypothetical protein
MVPGSNFSGKFSLLTPPDPARARPGRAGCGLRPRPAGGHDHHSTAGGVAAPTVTVATERASAAALCAGTGTSVLRARPAGG